VTAFAPTPALPEAAREGALSAEAVVAMREKLHAQDSKPPVAVSAVEAMTVRHKII
jgi:hypothetical protein